MEGAPSTGGHSEAEGCFGTVETGNCRRVGLERKLCVFGCVWFEGCPSKAQGFSGRRRLDIGSHVGHSVGVSVAEGRDEGYEIRSL